MRHDTPASRRPPYPLQRQEPTLLRYPARGYAPAHATGPERIADAARPWPAYLYDAPVSACPAHLALLACPVHHPYKIEPPSPGYATEVPAYSPAGSSTRMRHSSPPLAHSTASPRLSRA